MKFNQTMKPISLLFACCLLVLVSFSQKKSRLSFLYSPASNGVDIKNGWIGDVGHTGKDAKLFELRYSRSINSFLSLETGLQYAHNEIETDYFPDGVTRYKNSEINMVSVPVYCNLAFLKYFFAEAGPTLDFETNHSATASITDQSGIGFAFGLGGKYTYKNITLIVNPFFQRHLLLSPGSGDSIEHLWQSGVKFGAGYNF